jgi:RHS repeat-associated protein
MNPVPITMSNSATDCIDEQVVSQGAGTGGAIYYYHRNHQYSVTALTTSTGAIAERYAYSAYGQPTILDASASVLSSSAINNRYTYTGREWDATLGLYHFRARWMSPVAGRFLSRDPIGLDSDTNIYRALNGNPIQWVDPSGLVVPPYDSDDVLNCMTILKQIIAGTSILQLKPCARELLKTFVYGKGGNAVCPAACQTALDNHDWSEEFRRISSPRFPNIPCGTGAVKVDYSFHEFGSGASEGDLFWALKEFTIATMEASCTLACGPNQCGCCDCTGNCGAVIRVKDDYDFCSSLDPQRYFGNAYGTLVYTFAKCGCIIEDYYLKKGRPKTFKVDCRLGLKSELKFGYRKCGDD